MSPVLGIFSVAVVVVMVIPSAGRPRCRWWQLKHDGLKVENGQDHRGESTPVKKLCLHVGNVNLHIEGGERREENNGSLLFVWHQEGHSHTTVSGRPL